MGKGNSFYYEARRERDTEALAAALAGQAFAGMVMALDGELGAGKTRFSQAFAKRVGVTDVVSSPTFTLIKEYEGERYPFYHMDVYRLTSDEADELGLDEYFYGDGVTIVEWASRIADMLPTERLDVAIAYDVAHGAEGRRFTLQPHGQAYITVCEQLRENGVLL